MPPTQRDSSVKVSSGSPAPTPAPSVVALPPALQDLHQVLELTSLNSNGGQPARIANLNYSNVVANTGRGAQNAVANQQAHAQLAIAVLGHTSNRVKNLSPLTARSSVDVLTNDEVAQAIGDLRSVLLAFGGGSGPGPHPSLPNDYAGLIKILRRLLREIAHIMAVNARLSGDGSAKNPYKVSEGFLYIAAPYRLGFEVAPDQLKFGSAERGVSIVS